MEDEVQDSSSDAIEDNGFEFEFIISVYNDTTYAGTREESKHEGQYAQPYDGSHYIDLAHLLSFL